MNNFELKTLKLVSTNEEKQIKIKYYSFRKRTRILQYYPIHFFMPLCSLLKCMVFYTIVLCPF